nr:uncharacterized protein LOC109193258 [Ipomoea trifida]
MTSRRINGSNTTPTYDGEDSCVFTIKLHIGGNLVWKPKVEYKDGFVEYFDHFNCDEGSLLDLRRMVKQLRFADKKVQFWVKVKGRRNTKKIELRKVSTDADILVLNLEVPSNKELDIYVEHLYDDQWDYEVEISRSLGDDALMTDEGDEGSEQNSEREVDGPDNEFQDKGDEVDVEVNGPTLDKGDEVDVEVDEVDCVHSEEIFRSLDDSDSERECNGGQNVFQERNLKKDGFKFVLGMIFKSASEFKWAVTYHEAMRRKDIKFVKNEGRRVRVCCRHSDVCKWTIFGSRSNPRCPFQIKTYNPEHTCGNQDENRTINSGFLAKLYKDEFRLNMEWGRRQFQEHVKQKLHCQVTKHQAYRAKQKAKKEMEGQDSDQFMLLNDYCEELRRSNPGSKAEGDEPVPIPDLSVLGKQVISGQVLSLQDFHKVAEDKALGNQIIQALEKTGLLKLCTYSFTGVEIRPSDIKEVFELPESTLDIDNHAFNHQDFWNIIRGVSMPEQPKFSGFKRDLKPEFEMLIDILYKCVDCKTGSLDEIKPKKISLINAIWQGIQFNWAGYIWKKLSKFCTKALPLTKNNKFKQKIGYGFVISEILIRNGVNMRKGKKVACYKYLFRNHKTLRKKQIDSTSRATQSSDAPTAKAGQRRKRTSKVPEGGDSNEASYVVRSNANEEVVTSAMQITTTMSDVPNDEAAQMNSLPIQEELPGSNVETVANPIQIEVIDHELLEEREQFLDEDPVLTTELFRVKQWRLWRIAEYKSHMSRAGPEMEKEELFALSWIGTDDIAEALLLSTIAQAYSNKVQAKLAGSKGKLPVMEDNFQALSFVDFEEIDQANLHEGIQRSLLDFQHHPGATSSAQPESTPMQGEGQINEGELVDMCVNDKQVTIPESSNMQVMEPVASHIDETANEDMIEEPVMIPGHSHAMVQIVESVEGLGRIPAIVERPIIETEEILGGCETNQIPAEVEGEELATVLATVPVEVEELATDLATVPVEVQGQAEATILATVSSTVQVEEQATVLATVDNPLEVNFEVIENQDSLIEADIQISENLMDVQVEFPDEIQDNLEEEHALSTKRRKLVISGTSETSERENDDGLNMEVPTEVEGQMQLVTVPIQQKQAEFDKGILDLKKGLSSGNNEDEDNRLSSLFLKVDEFEQNKGLLNVIHQQQNQIIDLHNELSSLRRENAATSAKVNNIEAKVTKIDGNVDLLVDYAKKGEESSHLALSPSFAHIESSMGRGRGRGRGRSSGVSGFSQFAGTTGPKFGVIDYFREEQPKYTLNNAPPLIKKQPKKDQVAWVANQNRILEEELKKGPEVPRRKMIYLSDEVNMMKELMNYTGHEGKHLDGGRSFSECIKWFREGVLSGDSIQEAYGNYLSGQVQAKYKNAKFEGNFRDLRDHINRRIEEEAKGKKKS